MPDISYNVGLKVDKDYLSNFVSVANVTATMSQAGMSSVTLSLSTNVTNISTASLSSVGVAFLRNLSTDTAATVTVGVNSGATFVPFGTLRAGEPAVLRLASGASYAAIGASGSRLRVDVTEG